MLPKKATRLNLSAWLGFPPEFKLSSIFFMQGGKRLSAILPLYSEPTSSPSLLGVIEGCSASSFPYRAATKASTSLSMLLYSSFVGGVADSHADTMT
ncbi:MAG: hypothetical protein QW808_01830 [Desulfurococcaceae archaeon]